MNSLKCNFDEWNMKKRAYTPTVPMQVKTMADKHLDADYQRYFSSSDIDAFMYQQVYNGLLCVSMWSCARTGIKPYKQWWRNAVWKFSFGFFIVEDSFWKRYFDQLNWRAKQREREGKMILYDHHIVWKKKLPANPVYIIHER